LLLNACPFVCFKEPALAILLQHTLYVSTLTLSCVRKLNGAMPFLLEVSFELFLGSPNTKNLTQFKLPHAKTPLVVVWRRIH
jgi:hypothetical protein